MMTVEIKFKEQLATFKSEKKLRLIDIADGIGVSRRTIDYYLSGEKLPDVENLIRLADFFECSLDELVGRELTN